MGVVKLLVNQAVLDEVDRLDPAVARPIEVCTAKAIAIAIADTAHLDLTPQHAPHLAAFVHDGTINVAGLRTELWDLLNELYPGDIDSVDRVLVNALLGFVEWCGDCDGGPSWRHV